MLNNTVFKGLSISLQTFVKGAKLEYTMVNYIMKCWCKKYVAENQTFMTSYRRAGWKFSAGESLPVKRVKEGIVRLLFVFILLILFPLEKILGQDSWKSEILDSSISGILIRGKVQCRLDLSRQHLLTKMAY